MLFFSINDIKMKSIFELISPCPYVIIQYEYMPCTHSFNNEQKITFCHRSDSVKHMCKTWQYCLQAYFTITFLIALRLYILRNTPLYYNIITFYFYPSIMWFKTFYNVILYILSLSVFYIFYVVYEWCKIIIRQFILYNDVNIY